MIRINKLEGFYELQRLGIPSVTWKQYTNDIVLDDDKLWTFRVAVFDSNDLDLPRAVGVSAKEGREFAERVLNKYNNNLLIIYYPYFIAKKSGTLEVKPNGYVIEAVKKDLWNLVTHGYCDETIIFNGESINIHGDENFLERNELSELLVQEKKVRARLGTYIREGKSILLEWSYVLEVDKNNSEIGDSYLLFYECRAVI